MYNFLKDCKGVVQVGSNVGQEIPMFQQYYLNAILIEPLIEQYEIMSKVAAKAFYKTFNALISDTDGKEYGFNISNYNGQQSSIYDIKSLKMWTKIKHLETIKLTSITLDSLLCQEDMSKYDALIIDTQGSELLVLRGATKLLPNFKYILLEAADFELYKGQCVLKDIQAFMSANNYVEEGRWLQKGRKNIGSCWDILYKRLL